LCILRLIGAGIGTKQIAERLHLSVKTIETYREHLKRKLALADGASLAEFARNWAQRPVQFRGDGSLASGETDGGCQMSAAD
jgi:FixJ family two-component response regulator